MPRERPRWPAGNVVGVVLGGILAAVNWRLDFLISVPVGLFGSVWAYLALHEIGKRQAQPLDWMGNLTFAGGLLALMFGLTEALTPCWRRDMRLPALAAFETRSAQSRRLFPKTGQRT